MALPGRVTVAEVAEIIEVEGLVTALSPFIDFANELVTEKCVPAGYNAHRLKEIERWLAAHCYAILAPRTTMEKVSTIREQFQSKVDLGLDVTHYGQMAMRLDTKGALALMNNAMKTQRGFLGNIKPGIRWLGTIPEGNR